MSYKTEVSKILGIATLIVLAIIGLFILLCISLSNDLIDDIKDQGPVIETKKFVMVDSQLVASRNEFMLSC